MTVVAIAFAVASAVCAALGAYLQHGGVSRVTAGDQLRLRNLLHLARDSRWRLGVLAHVGTAVCQVLAISMAPLVVVQPVVVLSLPLVALLGTRRTGTRLGPLAITGIAAAMAGLVLFIVQAAATAESTTVSGQQAWEAARFVAVAALVLGILAATQSGKARCLAQAIAAGAIYGLVSVFIRHITVVTTTDGIGAVPLPSFVAFLTAFLTGSWLVQKAYASGPADLVVSCATTLNPIVAIGIGIAVLGETSGIDAKMTLSLASCGAIAVVGIAMLAASHARPLAATADTPDGRRLPSWWPNRSRGSTASGRR